MFSRTAQLIDEEGVALLAQKRVAVFGVGGVGGYVCEALARAGVGALDLYDHDVVERSNLNRQLTALHSSLGRPKAQVMAERIADINPGCRVRAFLVFYTPQNAHAYPLQGYDFVVDAVDTVSAKVQLARQALAAKVPILSAMGAGNKLYPERFVVTTLDKTHTCPLARAMRRELKPYGLLKLPVVCSTEPPYSAGGDRSAPDVPQGDPGANTKNSLGSISFVPGAAGLVLAGAVVRRLLCIDCGSQVTTDS